MVNKGLSSHFQITHSLAMSTTNPAQSGYKFGATYVGLKQVRYWHYFYSQFVA
jgi:mitochondrial import receptor subunit TOM40